MGVPPWLMEAALDTSGSCDRGAALTLLDEWLCRLAWLEHVPVYVRSVLAHRILKRNAFAAASSFKARDFAREYGGMSGETFYAMARVGELCERCPAIGAAFFGGDVAYSKMLPLARIATPDNEAAMVAAARSMSTPALEAFVRVELQSEGKSAPDPNDEPKFMLSADAGAPRSVLILLEWCQQLFRKMSGHPVTRAQVLEHAAVEWLAGPGIEGGGHSPGGWKVRPLAEGAADDDAPDEDTRETLEWEVCDLLDDLDDSVGLRALPHAFAALLDGLDDCDDRSLVDRFIACAAQAAPIELALGRLLGAFQRLGLARHTQWRTCSRYVKDRLGMSASRARMLARVDVHFQDDDEIMEAYRAGRLNALRLDVIRTVATESVQTEWGRRARADVVMVKRLEQEVRWALVERDLRGEQEIAPPPLGQRLPRVDQQISTHGGLPTEAEPVAPLRVVLVESSAHLVMHAIQSATRAGEDPLLALVRILLHAAATWSEQPKHRNKRFEKDDWLCQHPGCTAGKDLHSHHVVGRAQGGGNQHENLVTLCWFDHQVSVHGGHTRVWRDQNGVLNWELGRARGRAPLRVLKGSVIVAARAAPPAATLREPTSRC